MILRAVRVIVHSAEGLVNSVPNKLPSPYASVYLIGKKKKIKNKFMIYTYLKKNVFFIYR
jgi:hypothetical protein